MPTILIRLTIPSNAETDRLKTEKLIVLIIKNFYGDRLALSKDEPII
jgi:hypothetical protein